MLMKSNYFRNALNQIQKTKSPAVSTAGLFFLVTIIF
jgi:hypothetical protein